jgi:flavin-dependent dehydrogenase
MADPDFDCVVVGARCAGAPLATHLARAGVRVLLLESKKLPCDQPMSTHVIQTRGMDYIDALGVGARVRGLSPPLRVIRMELGGRPHDVHFVEGRSAHCLRRTVLDPILQENAIAAGAVLRDETPVTGLVRDGARVTGVEVLRNRKRERITARMVIGADGRNSTVAKHVGAEEYFGYDSPRGGYWAYWPVPREWTEDAPYSLFDMYLGFEGDSARFVFHADGDLLLIGTLSPPERLARFGSNHEDAYIKELAASPVTGPLTAGRKPVGRVLGLKKARFAFRTPVGPGWALVGDAGLHKDPTPGNGITDALRDASALAAAIVDGSERAFARYWRRRDVESFELYRQAEDLGSPGYDNPFNALVWENLHDPIVAHRVALAADRRVLPYDVVPPMKALSWLGRALLHGRFDVVPFFVEGSKRTRDVQQEHAHRKLLLDAIS